MTSFSTVVLLRRVARLTRPSISRLRARTRPRNTKNFHYREAQELTAQLPIIHGAERERGEERGKKEEEESQKEEPEGRIK
jgi:hypothetical protein